MACWRPRKRNSFFDVTGRLQGLRLALCGPSGDEALLIPLVHQRAPAIIDRTCMQCSVLRCTEKLLAAVSTWSLVRNPSRPCFDCFLRSLRL